MALRSLTAPTSLVKHHKQIQLNKPIFSVSFSTLKCHAQPIKVGFELEDVIESQQFSRDLLNGIFEVAQEMEVIERDVSSPGSNMLKGYLMATLFYEPSTRTRLSFESAMKRLGGEVLTTENAREFSSAAKGETLEGRLTFLTPCFFFVLLSKVLCF
jgi:Aspartate/ornithine carbamoyltransferase, carbamoyl-P binding domain